MALAKTQSGKTVVSHPIASLLAYNKSYRLVVSKDFAKQQIPKDFPVGALMGTYICDEQKGEIVLATETTDKKDAVVFCAGKDMCQPGDIEVGAKAAQEATLESTSLAQIFGSEK